MIKIASCCFGSCPKGLFQGYWKGTSMCAQMESPIFRKCLECMLLLHTSIVVLQYFIYVHIQLQFGCVTHCKFESVQLISCTETQDISLKKHYNMVILSTTFCILYAICYCTPTQLFCSTLYNIWLLLSFNHKVSFNQCVVLRHRTPHRKFVTLYCYYNMPCAKHYLTVCTSLATMCEQ